MHNFPLTRIDDKARFAKPAVSARISSSHTLAFLAVLLLPQDLSAALPELSFTAGSVEFQESVLHSVNGSLSSDGRLEIAADLLVVAGRHETARNLVLSCPQWQGGQNVFCPNGTWNLELGGLHSDRLFSKMDGAITAVLKDADLFSLSGSMNTGGLEFAVTADRSEDRLRVELSWSGQDLDHLKTLSAMPSELKWISRGSSDGSLAIRLTDTTETVIAYSIELHDLSFDSPEGRFAGESLQVESRGSLSLGVTTSAGITGRIISGELLLDDFYRDFSGAPLDFTAEPVLNQSMLEITGINVTDNSAMRLEGSAELDLDDPEDSLSFRISRLDLDFPGAYERYIEPVAAVWTLNGLILTGNISWSGDWINGAFESGEFVVNDLTIVDEQRRRFAITGLDAKLRPGDHAFDSRLSWQGLLLGRINLGAGEIALDSEPGTAALSEALELDVLGGRLTFHELGVGLPDTIVGVEENLDIRLRAELLGMDMEQYTAAMGWPEFSGEISGEIPGVSLDGGVLSVDGEISIEVFDGRITVDKLSVERPFGVLPSLAANVDVHDLDLEKLTRTFSFGQISGRLDGYVHDLRMLDWKPVAFDAWFGTPDRQGKSNDISRQAVNRLTTIGGGSATAALTGPIMKLFNNFSYRRLGLGCRLQSNVCEVRGISEDEVSVLIMEGAGLPKIMIRAFNRRMDWPQLVAGLVAIAGDEAIKVGD